jgi:hypothetical protein
MGTNMDDASFHICDVQLWIHNIFSNPGTAPFAQLLAFASSSLVFTTHTNGIHGEVISGTTHCCPVHALARCIIHIRHHIESSIIPFTSYYHNNRKKAGKAQDITSLLCQACHLIGPDIDLCEEDVSSRSLHAGGVMVLLCTQVNDNIIKLIGRL